MRREGWRKNPRWHAALRFCGHNVHFTKALACGDEVPRLFEGCRHQSGHPEFALIVCGAEKGFQLWSIPIVVKIIGQPGIHERHGRHTRTGHGTSLPVCDPTGKGCSITGQSEIDSFVLARLERDGANEQAIVRAKPGQVTRKGDPDFKVTWRN
jgi:hypothetical protein